MATVKTNELKKGTRVQLANGWFATIADNMRGNTRMATVEGIYTETGSVYAHDIVKAFVDGVWQDIKHTPAQLKMKNIVW
jgi:hypothetical protein